MSKEEEKEYYLSTFSPYKLYRYGFKYSTKDEGYTYIFPVLKYKNHITILCKVVVQDTDDKINLYIIRPNGDLWRQYYNRRWGNAEELIQKIDNRIKNKLNRLGFKPKKDKRRNDK